MDRKDYCRDDEREFRIREYGRTELACAYCGGLSPASAWKKFSRWMGAHPTLADDLRKLGYTGSNRSFTPAQVRAIVRALGEP